ncbi:MAG: glycoside hydrolase N-terminal domain-containing protein [Bacteroidota bacterium]
MKKFNLILISVFGGLIFNLSAQSQQNLWYSQPAQNWEEALPLGNGRLGVMVFGKTSNEHIQLNDDSMWPGEAGWDNAEGTKADLDTIRELLFQNKNVKADKFLVAKFSRNKVKRSHQTLGDLFIQFNHENITNYKRKLSLNNAISKVSYKTNGKLVTEKVFVSHPHRAIFIEFKTEAEDGLNGKVILSRPKDKGHPTVSVKTTGERTLVMQGEVTQRNAKFNGKSAPILEGVKFETLLKIENKGGEIIRGADFLELKNVKKATFCIVSNSSFYHDDYKQKNIDDLKALAGLKMREIEKRHIRDFQKLYSRVDLKLKGENYDTIPTDKRLERVQKGEIDLGLETLLYQYGRYLLISSSRKGTNPANLQGLWNNKLQAAWNGDYHMDINVQMNYWPANMTNLGELNYPLFDYIDRLVENGKVTAMKNFGCRGAFFPLTSDLWAPTWIRANAAHWSVFIGAGGWMMQHYWNHFEFNRDTTFLKNRAFPAIYEVAQFYSDWLIEDPRDGKLVSSPSMSPENRFKHESGKPAALCMGAAMDQQIIAEVFDNYMQACKVLKVENKLLNTIKEQRVKLREGFVIGSDGRILEWDREYAEHEKGHRHISHMYGFHPGNAVSTNNNPKIVKAIKKSLDYRLANGGAGTGWSRAWLINFSARLLDGDMAHEHIQQLLRKSMQSNLFDMCPPFQIDGNFGYTSGVTELMLQSQTGIIHLLPALPSKYSDGQVKGLVARGGYEVDIKWKNGKMASATVSSKYGGLCKVRYQDALKTFQLSKGESVVLNSSLEVISKTGTAQTLFRSTPFLQDPSEGGITVSWFTNVPSHGWVEYGTDKEFGNKAQTVIDGLVLANVKHHKVRLSKLEPGEKYYYRLVSREVKDYRTYKKKFGKLKYSDVYEFTLPDSKSTDFTAIIFNDLHKDKKIMKGLMNHVDSIDYDFVIFNGDCVADAHNEDVVVDFLTYSNELVGAEALPIFHIRGNHEARGSFAIELNNYIGYVVGDKTYGAFNWGDTRFVLLDCGEGKTDDDKKMHGLIEFSPLRKKQVEFVKEEVKTKEFKKAAKRVLVHHIPLYHNAYESKIPRLELWGDILNKANFNVSISGHTHRFAYHKAGSMGNDYPVVIGGGHRPDDATIMVLKKHGKLMQLKVLAFDGTVLGIYDL